MFADKGTYKKKVPKMGSFLFIQVTNIKVKVYGPVSASLWVNMLYTSHLKDLSTKHAPYLPGEDTSHAAVNSATDYSVI
jgi:hypothetical protein